MRTSGWCLVGLGVLVAILELDNLRIYWGFALILFGLAVLAFAVIVKYLALIEQNTRH